MKIRHSAAPMIGDISASDRGDGTRQKLLLAAIDVFGRLGFEGATTRALATAADVNLQAIQYYFGGKEGLYLAMAEYIASQVSLRVDAARSSARAALFHAIERGHTLDPAQARALLAELLKTLGEIHIGPASESWARVVIREQMEPTEAFARIYAGAMKPLLDTIRELVGVILGEDATCEHVRLRMLALVGGLMVFRVAHATVKAQLGWQSIGPDQIAVVRALAQELAQAVGKDAVGS
jgi:AcrR family transcriptional regulator